MRNIRSILPVAALVLAAGSAFAADPANDAAMKKLAATSG